MKRKKINEAVKRKLWASSGGHCCNPSCHKELIPMFENGTITCIDELAHIIAQQENGARGKDELPFSQRDEYDNLIILCPSCHTMVDKNPKTFTTDTLKKWKREHEESIKRLMFAPLFQHREEARNALVLLLEENKTIFDTYGPYSDNAKRNQFDTELIWNRLTIQKILPNNRKIEAILEKNVHLMTANEKTAFNLFKLHRDGFEFNKLSGDVNSMVPTFPEELNNIYK